MRQHALEVEENTVEAGDEWVRRETRRLGHVGFLTSAHTADGI